MMIEEEPRLEDFDDGNSSKRFKHDPELYEAPTAEEMYTLKNTENLYQSNLLRLQLDELLSEIKLSENELKVYNALINDLIKSLKNMKPVKDVKYSDLKLFENKNLNVPLGDLCKKAMKEGTYTFEPPKNVSLIGGFMTSTQVKTTKAVSADLCIEIGDSFFSERDYLNYRYFMKRNLYLSHVYLHLMNVKRYSKLKYEFLSDYSSPFKPLLCMLFEDEALEVRLHFVPNSSSFKIARFNPNQSNVRREFFTKNINSTIKFEESNEKNGKSETDKNDEIYDPTPNYNYDILSDLTSSQNNQYLKDKFNNARGVLEALKLLKVWLLKRDLNTGYGGFDNYTLSMFIAYLLSNRQINPLMSQYQIFRIVLINLSEANWDKKGISLRDFGKSEYDTSNESKNLLKLEEFHKYYEVVFLDPTGYMNITSKMTRQTFLKAKHDASVSLSLLNDEYTDNFDQLFIVNHNFQFEFDALININPNSNNQFYFDIVKKNQKDLVKLIDNYNNSYCIGLNILLDYVNKSLSERTNLISTELVKNLRWSINSKSSDNLPAVLIGVLFNDKFENVLIKGPSSTLPEALEFRKFWGPKSELRRFQDTSICEAVYFETNDSASKRLIYSEIVKHILNFHLSINESNLKFCDRQMNPLLSLPTGIINGYGTGEERLADVVNVFDEFSKIIKNFKELPLIINNIHGISSAFRLTDTFAPLPCCFNYDSQSEKNLRFKIDHKYVPKYPLGPVLVPYVKPLKVFIQLESSGKWPDDLECIKRLKSAFYMKIVQLLRENHGLVSYTHVNYLDVVYKGYVFRLFVYTMNELLCMKTEINEQGIRVTKQSKESLEYEKIILHSGKLTSVIHAGVCRLAKRWLSSQFLIEYFEEEAIDLLCAYLFVHSYEPPRSIIYGFIKFLDLVSNFDWKNQLLIINFNNEFKKQQIVDIQVRFQENRSTLPPVYISTPYDSIETGSIWTSEKPNIQQLCRTVIIAKQCLNKIKTSVLNFDSSESFKNIFRPNVDMYDVVINLKPSYCVKAFQKVDVCKGTFLPHYRNYDPTDDDKSLPVIDFDPVQIYVKELREAYDDIALFFNDVYGCTKIYVLWKPDALKPKELKINNVKYRLIDSVKNELVLNLEAILEDFKLIGNEFVESVNIKNESVVFK